MATADDIIDACQQARPRASLLFMEMPTSLGHISGDGWLRVGQDSQERGLGRGQQRR